jgi:hypothetical protein
LAAMIRLQKSTQTELLNRQMLNCHLPTRLHRYATRPQFRQKPKEKPHVLIQDTLDQTMQTPQQTPWHETAYLQTVEEQFFSLH